MTRTGNADRVLILTPHGRDGEVACRILEQAGMECHICRDMADLCAEITRGAGALLMATEAIPPKAVEILKDVLDRQPQWSEIPVLIFALPGPDKIVPTGLLMNRHFTILDRPVGVKALISATRAALRWRKRQYEVRNLMEALESRVHERDKFLAILGHELRNPLGAILLASQMVDESDGKLDGEHARLIERQSRHLTRLVDDLLDLSRITAGKIVLQRRAVDFRDVVRQTLETSRETIRSRDLEVTLHLAEEPVIVSGDPVRLEQIVGNVVTNAIKYTPSGGSIEISCGTHGRFARLRVKDTGVGIAPERIDSIFGLFTQAENAIGRSQGGMGIGLSLVRNLVDLHGGTVRAHSDGVGSGSEFVVDLPAEDTAQLPVRNEDREELEAAARIARKIVLVEDNPDVRMLLQLKLRRLGHDVESVGDGERGIERIETLRPDMAVVDIGLPGMSGYELAQEVRQRVGPEVFLVALSGFGQPEDKQRALEAGFNEHMTKPADVNDIEALLARVPRKVETDGQ